MCRFICEWIYAKQSEPQDTRGHFGGGGLGGHKSKSLGGCQRLDRLAPNVVQVCGFVWDGHMLNTFRPSTLRGGGVRGSQIQKSGEDSNGWSDWHHICRFIWEWIYAKQIAPRDTSLGGCHKSGGFRGSNNQRSGKAVKRMDRLAPTLVHICGFIWEWV